MRERGRARDKSPTHGGGRGRQFLAAEARTATMRSEEEIREQYEFLAEELESEEMRHGGVRELFTHYKRALGWVLEEEHM